MEKGSPDVESAPPTAYTVFIDTSLDTHLAMMVSDNDTVGDLKRKIMIEHSHCFPNVREIIIHALKVRRKTCFYHLSDSMHVKSAFDGVKGGWFLCADAAPDQVGPMENLHYLETDCGEKKMTDPGLLKKHDLLCEGNEFPETHTGCKKDKLKKRTRDVQCDDTLPEALEFRKIEKHKNEKKLKDAFCFPVKGRLNENDSGTSVSGKEISKPEKIFLENTLEDKEKITNVTSDGLLSKLLEDGHSPQFSLDNGKKEKKKKKNNKPSSLCEEGDPAVLSFAEDVMQESSKEAPGKNHKELVKEPDTAIAPEETIWSPTLANVTGISGKEKHRSPVQEVGDDNLMPCSSSGQPHVLATKAASVDMESSVAINMGESGGSKVESRTDAPGLAVAAASGCAKAKRAKKHRTASETGLTIPLVEEPDSLTWAITPLIYGNGGPGDHKEMPSEATTSKSMLVGGDEAQIKIKAGVSSSNPLDNSGLMEAQDLRDKRRKKSKRTKSSDAKSCILSSSVEHTNSAGDVIPLRSKLDRALDRGHSGDETNREGNILSQTGKTELSEIKDGGPANDNFGTDLTNKTEEKGKTLPQNEDPKIIFSDAANSNCKPLGQDEAEMNIKDAVGSSNLLDVSGIIEAGDPNGKRKRKSKKTKASHAKSYVLSSGVEKSKSVGDVIPSKLKPGRSFDSDHSGDETNRECRILIQTEKTEITKILDDGPEDDNFGTDLTAKTEKEKALPLDGDLKMMPSEAINPNCKSLVHDEVEVNIKDRVDSSNPLDAACVTDAGDPSDKRRKKSKKTKASVAKGRNLLSDLEHAHGSRVGIPLISDPEKAFCNDRHVDEINKDDNIWSQTEKTEVSKFECGDPGDDNFGTDLTDKIQKEKALPQNGDQKMMLSEATNSKEAQDPSSKRRKKSKKIKSSDSKSHGPECAGDVVPVRFNPDNSFNSIHPGGETNREDNILLPAEEMKTSKMKSLNAQLLDLDNKDGQGSGNEADFLQLTQVTNVQETTDYIDGKESSVKTLASASKSFLDLPIKVVGTGDPSLPIDEIKAEENASSKKMKKSRSGKKSSTDHLTDSMSKAGKQHQVSGDVGWSLIPSDAVECVQQRPLVNAHPDEANKCTEIPNFDSEKVNFIDYFMPRQDHHEVVTPAKELRGKEVPIRKSEKELKSNKKSKKLEVHSESTSDFLNTLNSNENQGHKKNTQGGISEKIQLQGPLSKDEQSRPAPQPNCKVSMSGDRVKAPTCNDHDKIDAFPTKVPRKKTVDPSGTICSVFAPPAHSLSRANATTISRENTATYVASSASTESSMNRVYDNKRHGELQLQSTVSPVELRGPYNKKIGKVLNSSNIEKSLLDTSNTIFNDSSTENSEDEVNNSDASTRSPSHNSSSSDYSEGAHEEYLESPGNGSHVQKRVKNGGNNFTESQSADPKNMTLDMILRSSRSYKKAKLTASQSQLDTESQPIDFVLDSQA